MHMRNPNVVLVFADQWRAQATGYAGDPNVKTPRLDALAQESLNFSLAISNCPVCSPYRGSLMTGQYPLTHGVFVNDVTLDPDAVTMGKVFAAAGYDTAYIGKWHLDGQGRSAYIPPERRQGFSYWKALECTHDYNRSPYYAGNDNEKKQWEGYDPTAQTRDAAEYIRGRSKEKPFLLVLSWGPPHNPYETAPQEYKDLYSPESIILRPNVPETMAGEARQWLAGYYAHCSALDACLGQLLDTLRETGLEENTLFLFTSDHGETLYDHDCYFDHHGLYDPTLVVPFIVVWKNHLPKGLRITDTMQLKDITPTLLDMMGIDTGLPFDGRSLMPLIRGGHREKEDEFYITECTWMRKHGWRTPEWKLMISLEPDFHYKPPVELYNLVNDPEEYDNLADKRPEVVKMLTDRMNAWIEKRVKETGRPSPIEVNFLRPEGPFATSDEAYHGKYIGSVAQAVALQKKKE